MVQNPLLGGPVSGGWVGRRPGVAGQATGRGRAGERWPDAMLPGVGGGTHTRNRGLRADRGRDASNARDASKARRARDASNARSAAVGRQNQTVSITFVARRSSMAA